MDRVTGTQCQGHDLEANGTVIALAAGKKFSAVVAALMVSALSLTGCGSAAGPQPSSTPMTTGVKVALGESAFDIGCDELVAGSELDSVLGAHVELETEERFGVESFQMFITALEQDGALRCDWGQLYKAPSLTLFALPDAAAGFDNAKAELSASSRYRELQIFDGSFYGCHYNIPALPELNCEWQILSGDVWVTVVLEGLEYAEYEQPDLDPANEQFVEVSEDSSIVRLLSKAVNAIVAAPRLELTRTTTVLGSCSELIDAAAVADLLPGDVEVFDLLASEGLMFGRATASEGDPMWALSMQRLGYRYCSVTPPPSDGYSGTGVTIAPGGTWAFDSSKQQPVDGLGPAISECTSTQDGPFCLIAVLVGDTLVTVESNEASPVVGLAVIKEVVANLN